jgi:hypothetical protein
VKIIGNRVVAAKLSGSVDFLELESYSHGRQMDWGFTAYRRSELHQDCAWNSVECLTVLHMGTSVACTLMLVYILIFLIVT